MMQVISLRSPQVHRRGSAAAPRDPPMVETLEDSLGADQGQNEAVDLTGPVVSIFRKSCGVISGI